MVNDGKSELEKRARAAEAALADAKIQHLSLENQISTLQDKLRRQEEEAVAAAQAKTEGMAQLKRDHFVALEATHADTAALKLELQRLKSELQGARDGIILEQQQMHQHALREQLDHQNTLSQRDKEWRQQQHEEEVKSITARYEARIKQLESERAQGATLETLMNTVSSSAEQVRGLGLCVSVRARPPAGGEEGRCDGEGVGAYQRWGGCRRL